MPRQPICSPGAGSSSGSAGARPSRPGTVPRRSAIRSNTTRPVRRRCASARRSQGPASPPPMRTAGRGTRPAAGRADRALPGRLDERRPHPGAARLGKPQRDRDHIREGRQNSCRLSSGRGLGGSARFTPNPSVAGSANARARITTHVRQRPSRQRSVSRAGAGAGGATAVAAIRRVVVWSGFDSDGSGSSTATRVDFGAGAESARSRRLHLSRREMRPPEQARA